MRQAISSGPETPFKADGAPSVFFSVVGSSFAEARIWDDRTSVRD